MRGMSEVDIGAHLRSGEACACAKEPAGGVSAKYIKLSPSGVPSSRAKKARHSAPHGRRTASADIGFIFDGRETEPDAPPAERASSGVWALVRASLSTPPPPAHILDMLCKVGAV